MIHLDVEDYCENCMRFVPVTEVFDVGALEKGRVNTTITCEHAKECVSIWNSMVKHFKEKYGMPDI